MKRKVTQNISWQEQELLDAAKAKAQSMGLSLSHYVRNLVRLDTEGKGLMDSGAGRVFELAKDYNPKEKAECEK